MHTVQEWFELDNQEIAWIVAQNVSTAAIYLNGTRRWFLSQSKDWSEYGRIIGKAHRELSQMFFDHGIKTLLQPLLGYDLLQRGQEYVTVAVEHGLIELAAPEYRHWYRQNEIKVNFYGNWSATLNKLGLSKLVKVLEGIIEETGQNIKHDLLFGIFADEGLDRIVKLAKNVEREQELIKLYYGQIVSPVDLVVGSGQPVIWDLPLLDINRANLYFIQAPTYCLTKEKLRQILYDHLYQRVNDDGLYGELQVREWTDFDIVGLGQQTQRGWVAA
jgi:hypothetical protein